MCAQSFLCELKDSKTGMHYCANIISRMIGDCGAVDGAVDGFVAAFLLPKRSEMARLSWADSFISRGRVYMDAIIYSEDVIEAMVDAMCGPKVSEHDKNIYREALRGLVRLGQAEQLLSMQLDFNKLTSPGFHH